MDEQGAVNSVSRFSVDKISRIALEKVFMRSMNQCYRPFLLFELEDDQGNTPVAWWLACEEARL